MYMYTKIHNPLTNRYVKINSKIGKNILRRYLEIMGGNPIQLIGSIMGTKSSRSSSSPRSRKTG